jgi:hypothetical protein
MKSMLAETYRPPEAVVHGAAKRKTVKLTGHWTLRGFADRGTHEQDRLRRMLALQARDPAARWDLCGVEALDSVGEFFLSRSWQNKCPAHQGCGGLLASPNHEITELGLECDVHGHGGEDRMPVSINQPRHQGAAVAMNLGRIDSFWAA